MKKLATLSFLSLVLVLTSCTGKSETSEKAEPVSEEVVETSEEAVVETEEELDEEVVEELVLKEEEPAFVELTNGEVKEIVASEVYDLRVIFDTFRNKWYDEEKFPHYRPEVSQETIKSEAEADLANTGLSDAFIQSDAFLDTVYAYTCDCGAGDYSVPNKLENRFQVNDQNESTIHVSFLDFLPEHFDDISAYVWEVELTKEDEQWTITNIESDEEDVNLTFEEIQRHHGTEGNTLTLVDEPIIEGVEYVVAEDQVGKSYVYRKSDGKSNETVMSEFNTNDLVVADTTETATLEEDKPYDINDPIMETFVPTSVSLDDLQSFEYDWTDYVDQPTGFHSVKLTYLGDDLFDVRVDEATPYGKQLETYEEHSIKLENNALHFSYDFAGHSDSTGVITIQLQDNGVRYIKKVTDQQSGWFNWDVDVTLTKAGKLIF